MNKLYIPINGLYFIFHILLTALYFIFSTLYTLIAILTSLTPIPGSYSTNRWHTLHDCWLCIYWHHLSHHSQTRYPLIPYYRLDPANRFAIFERTYNSSSKDMTSNRMVNLNCTPVTLNKVNEGFISLPHILMPENIQVSLTYGPKFAFIKICFTKIYVTKYR